MAPGMLGHGTYFGEDCEKADQYATPGRASDILPPEAEAAQDPPEARPRADLLSELLGISLD